HLDELDQKLWVALACPTQGLEFDARTLALIDTDKDGRIRVPEILAATQWAVANVIDPEVLLSGSDSLPLSAIRDPQILASAKQILAHLGKPDADRISVEDVADTARIFAQTRFNGDGIIPAEAAEDDFTRGVIADIIACVGAETDRSGKPGISQAKVDQFFAELQAFADWSSKAVLPFGERTPAAAAAVRAVKAKVEDYFARCRLAAFDPRALAAVNRQESEYLALAAKDLTITAIEVAGFPLAKVEPHKPLPLKDGVNPAWAEALGALIPLVGGKTVLTEADWAALLAKLAPYEAWMAGKAGGTVEKLGLARVKEILASPAKETIAALIARDKALDAEFNAISVVERLVRYNRDLVKLLNNFVSFRDFYKRKDKAIFQVGTLYMDQRSCDLCIRVEDMAKHSVMAGLSRCYLAYCECTRKSTGEKMTIAAAFTNGDSDNLMVGRNGVFYDRQGRDWDATIVKIVDNPISIRQAFWMPYKKFVRMIEEQIAKRAAAAEAAADAKLSTAAATVATADQGKAQPPKKIDVGTVAAIGVAVGGITAALGALLQTFFGLGMWMPLGIVGLVLLISGPSMIMAALKLRQRNLAPLLDANGWAVNAKAKINIPFGSSLTRIAALPPGAHRDLTDPFR
ncbi:MAG: hypothetical protein N3B01_09570, partial [Verrucomicrobiae bacterium]|nr:hypothetical protein [Verrucomicrobiae bacterium]